MNPNYFAQMMAAQQQSPYMQTASVRPPGQPMMLPPKPVVPQGNYPTGRMGSPAPVPPLAPPPAPVIRAPSGTVSPRAPGGQHAGSEGIDSTQVITPPASKWPTQTVAPGAPMPGTSPNAMQGAPLPQNYPAGNMGGQFNPPAPGAPVIRGQGGVASPRMPGDQHAGSEGIDPPMTTMPPAAKWPVQTVSPGAPAPGTAPQAPLRPGQPAPQQMPGGYPIGKFGVPATPPTLPIPNETVGLSNIPDDSPFKQMPGVTGHIPQDAPMANSDWVRNLPPVNPNAGTARANPLQQFGNAIKEGPPGGWGAALERVKRGPFYEKPDPQVTRENPRPPEADWVPASPGAAPNTPQQIAAKPPARPAPAGAPARAPAPASPQIPMVSGGNAPPAAPAPQVNAGQAAPQMAPLPSRMSAPASIAAAQPPANATPQNKGEWARMLMDFGLQTMAASGQPGVSTASALGQGGLAALNGMDRRRQTAALQQRTARQDAREDARLGLEFEQSALERDKLDVLAKDKTLDRDLQAQIANQAAVLKQLEIAAKNGSTQATNQLKVATLQANIDNNAAQYRSDTLAAMGGDMGIKPKPEEIAALDAQVAQAFPGSTFARIHNAKAAVNASASNLAAQRASGAITPEEYNAEMKKLGFTAK